ncbi:hypothetical protein [Desulforamulus hydrothermalis]|uniref:Uncharacterized protein n=1 Tax=Desulforamulus hydrothermalis Lam5 = DSM 18033 TaxID=1121428 RepID=K8DZS4_9FIRM|nr:hypothetical protein [Desulforamulus hydrothermalis]CCO08550.1 hypothetical protein DESHY_40100 [Desulforamulus hydrothermalis Lam5 = DSM 18033]SHH02390.1 hypothetical protein SAMN02745177_01176 [Desulforamulus hydrothermalis Lam5 = DSM 18033]
MAGSIEKDFAAYLNQYVVIGFGSWLMHGRLSDAKEDYVIVSMSFVNKPVNIYIRKSSLHFISACEKEDYEYIRRHLQGLPLQELQAP